MEQYPYQPRIPYPLSQEDIKILKDGFIWPGTGTLASGSLVVKNPRIRTTSVAVAGYNGTLSNAGHLKAVCTDGTLTITSDSSTDASPVAYFVIF